MTRRWLAVSIALIVGTMSVTVVRGQTSLADRIGQLRRDWGGSSAAQPARPPSARPSPGGTTSPRAPDLLPKIDPRSLLPTNLFGRTAGGNREGDDAAARRPRAGSRYPQNGANGAAADNGRSVADGFTLPGLSRPTATANAPRTRAASRPVTPITPIPDDEAVPQIALRPRSEPAPPSAAVRRSPTTRHHVDFDPEVLRKELAGTFSTATEGIQQPPASNTSDATRPESNRAPDPADESGMSFSVIEQYVERTEQRGRNEDATKNAGRQAESDPTAARAFQTPGAEGATDRSLSVDKALPAPVSRLERVDLGSGGSLAERPSPTSSQTAVLVENQAPVIAVDVRGPKQIMIGREATYRVRLQNEGAVAADELTASMQIPSWAEVVGTSATHGVVRQAEGSEAADSLTWQIPRLDPQASQTLELRIVPRGSRPLELGIRWSHAAVTSRAVVEVQEPKLEMHVAGPEDVLFGKSYTYHLQLTNPGTGTAEGIEITLLPPGGGEQSTSTHRLGDLAPGATRDVELQLTPRDAGKLSVEAVATAAGGLKAQAGLDLFCRKAEIDLDWRGPSMQYAGTTATYFLRVRNPGTAPADDVTVRTTLPTGGLFVGGSEGHGRDSANGDVVWRVGTLGPGDDCYMEFRCQVNTPGENQLRVTATSGPLSDAATAVTNVVALADLTLAVSDPPGPVLVGEDAEYEIRVTNRGSSAADDVNVVALFSSGLEPAAAEGGSYDVADGRVTFHTIRTLPAGEHVLLRIRARAVQAGTHVFRAEVLCRDLEIKLAAEETTRFYSNEVGGGPTSATPTSIGQRYGEAVK